VPLVSVELDEILGASDRNVMFDGSISGERLPDETDERDLGLMAGVTDAKGRLMSTATWPRGDRPCAKR
jgi:hypothetical protein